MNLDSSLLHFPTQLSQCAFLWNMSNKSHFLQNMSNKPDLSFSCDCNLRRTTLCYLSPSWHSVLTAYVNLDTLLCLPFWQETYYTMNYDRVLCSSFFQLYDLKPKQDLHGLGYDPYKHAPEFRGQQSCYMNSRLLLLTLQIYPWRLNSHSSVRKQTITLIW